MHIEDRLREWAMHLEQPEHQAGFAPESIEYRLQAGIGSKPGRKGRFHGDGGMVRAYTAHGRAIKAQQRAMGVHRAVLALKRYDRRIYDVLTLAYLARPGFVTPGRQGADELDISHSAWRDRQTAGVAFVAGVLFSDL